MHIINAKFMSPVFTRACKLAGIQPTRRQASRWRNNKGLARRYCAAAILELAAEEKAK